MRNVVFSLLLPATAMFLRRESPRKASSNVYVGSLQDLKDLPLLHSLRITDVQILHNDESDDQCSTDCFPQAFQYHHFDLNPVERHTLGISVARMYAMWASEPGKTSLVVSVDRRAGEMTAADFILARYVYNCWASLSTERDFDILGSSYVAQAHLCSFDEAYYRISGRKMDLTDSNYNDLEASLTRQSSNRHLLSSYRYSQWREGLIEMVFSPTCQMRFCLLLSAHTKGA